MSMAPTGSRAAQQLDAPPGRETVKAARSRHLLRQRGRSRRESPRDEFLATAAHELRNAVTAMSGALEVIARSVEGPTREAAIKIARQQVASMRCLLDDVSEFASGGRATTLHRESVVLQEVIADTVAACRPMLEARQHRVEVDTPAEPIRVHADAQRLSQVLVNLLVNAAKFTPRGGHVAVSASREGAMAEIRVADDGAGIEPAALQRIFEPFGREERCQDLSPTGQGIGLAVARRLIELHGGSVRATSAGAGRGATLFVRLPL